jgi:hypothetical protein
MIRPTSLMSDLPRRYGWTTARLAGDRSPAVGALD